jgi:S1-C subfamily serine protease
MTSRKLAAAAVALALGAGTAAGCSLGGDDDDGQGSSSSGSGDTKTTTTRVQVVEGQGTGKGLDARALFKNEGQGVVTVISLFGSGSLDSITGGGGGGGVGSGFVLNDEGEIATNAHVVTQGEGEDAQKAREIYVEFADGNRVEAEIKGQDPNADVALLKVDPSGLSLTPLKLGHSSGIAVGEPVAAIGSPFGERQSLSIGVISALDRTIRSLTQFEIGDAIQTDAAINPGNSGGPLLDAEGRVIGINAQIKSQSGGGEGVGFAIPVDAVRRSLGELRENGRVDYGSRSGPSSPTGWTSTSTPGRSCRTWSTAARPRTRESSPAATRSRSRDRAGSRRAATSSSG